MKSLSRFVLPTLTLSLLTACATYEQPAETAPNASATFNRSAGAGGNILSQGRLVSYYVATNDSCSEAPRVAFFGTGDFSGDKKTIRLKPGKPIKLLSFIEINDAGLKNGQYARVGQNRCVSEAGFTPINGQAYDISLNMNAETGSCSLSVIDRQTAGSPADLIQDDTVCADRPRTIPD